MPIIRNLNLISVQSWTGHIWERMKNEEDNPPYGPHSQGNPPRVIFTRGTLFFHEKCYQLRCVNVFVEEENTGKTLGLSTWVIVFFTGLTISRPSWNFLTWMGSNYPSCSLPVSNEFDKETREKEQRNETYNLTTLLYKIISSCFWWYHVRVQQRKKPLRRL